VRAWDLFERPALERRALDGYRRERWNQLALPIGLALMEGGFVGVIADKVYHVHPVVLAVTAAAPMLGNIASFAWSRLARGRRKVPIVMGIEAGICVSVAAVVFAPHGAWGAALLVTALIAARVLIAGEVTVRSTIWSLNYPREVRARFTGRLQVAMTLSMALTSFAASYALDRNPESFRLAYALGAVASAFGVVAFARVPHIGEEAQLALERSEPEAQARGVRDILRSDPLFARYQACQFVLGMSNMMIEGSLVYLVSRELQASYLWSIAITVAVPSLLSTATLPLWAAYIDRVHIARFRVTQSGFWLAYQALLWLGAWLGSLWVLALARAILGLARGGGGLAWQLGHNDFSSPRDLGAYMGAHVTLTGVRGAFAPFVGILLYAGSSGWEMSSTGFVFPAFAGLGSHTYGICCALVLTSAIGFRRLERDIDAKRKGAGAVELPR
jgi:MFS family permease